MELQRTFEGDAVPTKRHPADLVVTVEGETLLHRDVKYDCRGGAHCDEDARDEADAEIVKEIIDDIEMACTDYATSDEYAEGYFYLIDEGSAPFERIAEWLLDNDLASNNEANDLATQLYSDVESNITVHHQQSEYASYAGQGVCLYSLEIGECEEQVDICSFPEFERLHKSGGLEQAIARYHGDAYPYAHTHYENRKHVRKGYVRGNCFTLICSPGGCWHYVVSTERLKEALADIKG